MAGNTTLVTANVTAGLGSVFAAADGTTVVTSGSGLLLDTSLTGEPLYLFGNGAENQSGHYSGALENASGANTYTGTMTLENAPPVSSTPSTIGVDGTSVLTITSPAVGTPAIIDLGAGSLGLQKEGTGTLILNSVDNYQGGTTVNQGILNVQNNNALGLAGTTTTVLDGAQLQLQGNVAVTTQNLSLSGTGILNSGALENAAGNNTWGLSATISAASEVAHIVTITTASPNSFFLGETIVISNVAVAGYNGTYTITGVNAGLNQFTYTDPINNLTASGGGVAGTAIFLNASPSFSPESAPGSVTIGVLNAGEILTIGSTITQPAAGASSPAAPALTMTGGLTKVGLGKLTLTQNDTYSGTNYVNNGILDIQNSGALGTANGNEIQRITTRDPGAADSFTLTFGGDGSIPFGATATQVATALNGLGTLGAGAVTVAENDVNSGISQVETATLTNVIAGNTIQWSFGGLPTAPIPYTGAVGTQTDALAIQAALNAAGFATIGGLSPFPGSVTVTANYTDTVFTITFGGYLADSAQGTHHRQRGRRDLGASGRRGRRAASRQHRRRLPDAGLHRHLLRRRLCRQAASADLRHAIGPRHDRGSQRSRPGQRRHQRRQQRHAAARRRFDAHRRQHQPQSDPRHLRLRRDRADHDRHDHGRHLHALGRRPDHRRAFGRLPHRSHCDRGGSGQHRHDHDRRQSSVRRGRAGRRHGRQRGRLQHDGHHHGDHRQYLHLFRPDPGGTAAATGGTATLTPTGMAFAIQKALTGLTTVGARQRDGHRQLDQQHLHDHLRQLGDHAGCVSDSDGSRRRHDRGADAGRSRELQRQQHLGRRHRAAD